MRIPSDEIPQADNLSEVIDVVRAVAGGAETFTDLAAAIGLVERQGRYYRLAAEILGLIYRPVRNTSRLTALGARFMASNGAEQREIITQAVLATRIVERLIPFLERAGRTGVTREKLQTFLDEVADMGGSSMAGRRASTVISWMAAVGLVSYSGNRVTLNQLPKTVPLIDFAHIDEPLFPREFTLDEYEEQSRRIRSGTTTVLIDQAQVERAEASHKSLTDLMAARLRAYGAVPKRNKLVDLAAVVDGFTYLFEMKSTTIANVRAQIRRGLSQLYEYRYLQNAHDSRLVLVIENELEQASKWMGDYLVEDRGVLFVWDGNQQFVCRESIRPSLPFLN